MRLSTPCTTTARQALSRAAVVVLLAVLGLTGVWSGPAAAADDVPWGVSTASNSYGSHRQNYGYTVNPGGKVEDGLVVVNHGTTPLDLAVYAADAFTNDAGRLDLRTKDTASTDVGTWVHADRSRLRLQPGQSVEVPLTITVPDDATPGDHMGGIVTSLTRTDEAKGIDVDRRLAIRIHLRVGGDVRPSLSVEDLKVHYSGTSDPFGKGDATVTYTIHNTGNSILAARQSASVSGPFGRWQARSGQVDDSPHLLPGETWKVIVPVHGVTPALQLTGTVTLVPLLTDAANSISPLTAVESTTHTWTTPWALLTLLVLILVVWGLVAVVLASRRRRRRAGLREDAGVQEAVRQASPERQTSDQ
ncbi:MULTISPECIES: WxL protein peptidoglycan domain-containing protein [Streptomyces]|uniref:WxL protein peptidoglycan domain-containing protein n=2 Tax=Streptomyces TaxID=1883 RepID=A0ABV9J5Q8_9ACTN